MRREPIPQLTSVSREVQRHLAQLVDEHLARRLVAREMARQELVALLDAGVDGPEEQVGDVDGDGGGEGGEAGGVVADRGGVASCVEGEDVEGSDALRLVRVSLLLIYRYQNKR